MASKDSIKGNGWTAFFRDSDGQWVLKEKKPTGQWSSHRIPKKVQAERDVHRYVKARQSEQARRSNAQKRVELMAKQRNAKLPVGITVKQLGQMWTSGELARRFPDHINAKASSGTDASRFKNYVYPIIGDLQVIDFDPPHGLEHAEKVMAALPPSLGKSSRGQVAQLLRRLLKMAHYPLKLLPTYPLPDSFVPRRSQSRAKTYLFPAEEAKLLSCQTVPLVERLYFGFLAREGSRPSEARLLQLQDIDYDSGIAYLDDTKTNRPRDWALEDDTLGALRIWRRHFMADDSPTAHIFATPEGKLLDKYDRAEMLREYVKTAGVTRHQLFIHNERRLQLRAHDLRASFVTVSLAEGRSETWVADKTGHMSSQMIQTYRRWSRTHTKRNLGAFRPLNKAIPELAALDVDTQRR